MSFQAILGACLDRHTIWDLDQLLVLFSGLYAGYSGTRIHGPTAYLWPELFEQAWHSELIERTVDSRCRVKFELRIPYQDLLSGGQEPEGSLLLDPTGITIPPAGVRARLISDAIGNAIPIDRLLLRQTYQAKNLLAHRPKPLSDP